MKMLAEYVKDNNLSSTQVKDTNEKINTLNLEVIELDEKSKTFSKN